MVRTQDLHIKTQDQEIRRLSTIVSRHEAALKSDNRKLKPEVLEMGLYSLV